MNAYTINSLEEWRMRLQLRHRQLMVRYVRMRGRPDHDISAQGLLIDTNTELIRVVAEAITKAKGEHASGAVATEGSA